MCSRVFWMCLVFFCVDVNCFNLDTVDYALHRGEQGSMFGFSVTTHSYRRQNWVIIGAPEAQSSVQPTVYKGGAVYYCPVDRDDDCREVRFDTKGNNMGTSGNQIDEKSKQWFGATVNSGGPDQPFVACAPRYLWFTTKNDRRDPVGTCYVAQNVNEGYSEFSPCRTRHWGYHRQGHCQAGLGAAISKNGDRLFIGAPGSWYWQGQVYSIYSNATFPYAAPANEQYGEGQMYSVDPDARFPYTPPRYSDFGAGQLYSQHVKKRPSVFFTKEGEPLDDDSYMGYSVTVGNFTGDADGGVAAGMPKGNRLRGKVVVYTWNLTNHQNISGSQLGAYFGYSVAAADMNGDGLDDLIVGAPLHTEPNNEGKYEVGRVFVIYPMRIRDDPDAAPGAVYPKFRKFVTIDGLSSKGRFGLSVACLGDLDLDGYQDIAVGAPYDGPMERGAVYIYYGSRNGVREKASQIIYAEDVSQSPMYTFGFSVGGNGIDLDNNQYPDLVVGAYLSNSAFIIRSRPVINVDAKVAIAAHKKQISLEERNCSLSRDKYVSCTSFEACVKYNGIGVSNGIELEMEFILDAKKTKDPRMFHFPPSERKHRFNETWTLRRNDKQCRRMQVYIRENTRDKLTPLDVELRYSLKQRQRRDTHLYRRNPRSDLEPVLNGNLPSSYKDSIVIKKNCGDDDVCIPNLRLIVSPNVDKYLLGSNNQLKIDVRVLNDGEDSFESMFYMKLPPGINYFNTEQVNGSQVKCSAPSEATNNTLKCDIGNPLSATKMVHFRVLLDPYKVEGMKASYDFSMKINSTNPEDNSTIADNVRDISVEIWIKTNISLSGWAQYPDIHYKEESYKKENYTMENEIGPHIVHIYNIKNHGPSDINEAEIIFLWPSQTLEGDDLLYLMEDPETSDKIQCEIVPEVNPLKVQLLSKKYLDATESHKASGQVSYEDQSAFNAATGATRHDEKRIELEDKFSETGDSSLDHVRRRGGHGGVTHHQEERTYNWTSTSVNGGPTETRSWNTSTITGQDGVTHSREASIRHQQRQGQGQSQGQNQGQGQRSHNYHIISTSTGQATGGQAWNQRGQTGHESRYSGSSEGSRREHQYGTVHHTSQTGQNHDSKQGESEYFNWDGSIRGTSGNSSRPTGEVAFGTVQTHRTSGQTRDGNNAGTISGSGEMVYSRNTTNTGGHVSGQSGYLGQSGHFSGQSGYSGHSGQSGHFSGQSGYSGQSGQSEHFSGQSGYLGQSGQSGHSSGNLGQRGQGSIQGTVTYDQHGTSGQAVDQRFGVESETDTVFREFVRISGYNVSGLISEEDLRRMIQTGSGEFNNGTHRITWTSSRDGGFRIQNETNLYRPLTISTEESVNKNLDEYISRAQGGRSRATYGQGYAQDRYNRTDYDGLGGAALGAGFRTTSLDLGVMGSASNQGQGSSHEYNYGSTYYDPDLGSYEDRSSEQTHGTGGSVSYGQSRTYSSSGRHSTSSGSRTFVGDNVPTDRPSDADYRNRIYRQRRQADDDLSKIVQCQSTRCSVVRCKTKPLEKDEEAWAALRFRANAVTLKKIGWTRVVNVSSMMVSRINKLPYIGMPLVRPVHTHEVFTNVTLTEMEIKPDVVPLWVVVLSACAGTIILLLLIFLLYKCGFFKRNRPSDAPERQPLNRNGHYHGDEQL